MSTIDERLRRSGARWRDEVDRAATDATRRRLAAQAARRRRTQRWVWAGVTVAALAAIAGPIWLGLRHTGGQNELAGSGASCAGPLMRVGGLPGDHYLRQADRHRLRPVAVSAGSAVVVGGRYYMDDCADTPGKTMAPLRSVRITLTPRGAPTRVLAVAHPHGDLAEFRVVVTIPADASGSAVLGDGGITPGVGVTIRR